ncbi:MAG: hypothetical protein ABMA64_22085 [Myxococcota bacterium]
MAPKASDLEEMARLRVQRDAAFAQLAGVRDALSELTAQMAGHNERLDQVVSMRTMSHGAPSGTRSGAVRKVRQSLANPVKRGIVRHGGMRALSLSLSLGCNGNDKAPITPADTGDTGADNGLFPVTVNCHGEGECTAVLQILNPMPLLTDCLGADCTLYPATNCWPPGTPVEIIENCDATSLWHCEIPSAAFDVALETDSDPDCACVGMSLWDLGLAVGEVLEDECCVDPNSTYLQQFGSITSVLDACEQDIAYNIFLDDCTPAEPASWEVCDPWDVFPVAPGAGFVLNVDPTNSYLHLASALGSETVAVRGGGSARSGPGPDRFLTATVAADDGVLGPAAFTDWLWWMDGPLLMDVTSGTITVPMDETVPFEGTGWVGSTRMLGSVQMGDDAYGTINPVAHTWALDFTQVSDGFNVQVHLTGSYEDVP